MEKLNVNDASQVKINDDLKVNYNSNSDEVSLNQTVESISEEKNENTDIIPNTIRKEKLLAVSHLFQLCYRTVIPHRLPTSTSNMNLLSEGLGSFNPRPIGIFLFLFIQINSFSCNLGREIARSINNFIGQWRTQPR